MSQEILTVIVTSYYENVCSCKKTVVRRAFCFWWFALLFLSLATDYRKSWCVLLLYTLLLYGESSKLWTWDWILTKNLWFWDWLRLSWEDFWIKSNSTVTACLVHYIDYSITSKKSDIDHSITSKKSDDFWRWCALLLGMLYLKYEIYIHCLLTRYTHCYQNVYLLNFWVSAICDIYALDFLWSEVWKWYIHIYN